MRLGGVINPQPTDRVISREHHHLNAWIGWQVKGQQFLNQPKSHARVRWLGEPLPLQSHVRLVIGLFKDSILFLEVEQGPRRNGNDQLVVEGRCQGLDV